jgi:Kdo2-lipid IVA lauroyltransferase/acyltransferase
MNAVIESQDRRQPHQYFWLHKRFKSRPEAEADFYRGKPNSP